MLEVVRGRPHIDLPRVHRELEAIHDEVPGNVRLEPHGVLVEIHVGVDAPRLFVVGLTRSRRCVLVQRFRLGGEEAESIDVRAAQADVVDNSGDLGRAEAK